MKKKCISLCLILLLLGIIAAGIRAYPTIKSGIAMYTEALQKTSLKEKIKEIQNRPNFVAFDAIPEDFIEALIENEDKRFYLHFGIDPIAIIRAMYYNWKAGEIVQGGSTLTQQLAKNLYFTFEQKYERKIAEILVAFDLERHYTKKEILTFYCNIVYFGEGCYGIYDASMHYFNTTPEQLTKEQCLQLVYTLQCPEENNPNQEKTRPDMSSNRNVFLTKEYKIENLPYRA